MSRCPPEAGPHGESSATAAAFVRVRSEAAGIRIADWQSCRRLVAGQGGGSPLTLETSTPSGLPTRDTRLPVCAASPAVPGAIGSVGRGNWGRVALALMRTRGWERESGKQENRSFADSVPVFLLSRFISSKEQMALRCIAGRRNSRRRLLPSANLSPCALPSPTRRNSSTTPQKLSVTSDHTCAKGAGGHCRCPAECHSALRMSLTSDRTPTSPLRCPRRSGTGSVTSR